LNKIIYTGDQDPLLAALDGVVATYFDNDHSIKSASSSAFSKKLIADHIPDDKHFGVHYVALGASEYFGPNRNGDWWNEPSLKHEGDDYGMHTFVKHGHYFREHRNRDPKQAIGSIRAAAYNPEMHRGELIIWGDKDKAEKEYREAKAGKNLDGSMSARVAGDVCSICNHFASKSKDYCVHAKEHMTQWWPKKSKFVYVDNVKPKFFDFSAVENRADRIARHLEIMFHPDDMKKAASYNGFLFSDVQAAHAGIVLPDSLRVGCYSPDNQAWLEKLSSVEAYIGHIRTDPDTVAKDSRYEFFKQAATYAFDESEFTEQQLDALRKVEPSVLFGYLAKRAAVLPFLPFFAYSTNQTLKLASEDPAYNYAKKNLLTTLFQDAASAPADAEIEQMFTPASSIKVAACPIDDATEKLLEKVCADNTIEVGVVRNRILQLCAKGQPVQQQEKSAAEFTVDQINKAKVVAKAYAFFKIAFCNAVVEKRGEESIDDAALLLINSQHN
jgi:hypothetical protein